MGSSTLHNGMRKDRNLGFIIILDIKFMQEQLIILTKYCVLLQWPAEMSTFFGKITRVECVLSCQCKCNLQEKSCEFKFLLQWPAEMSTFFSKITRVECVLSCQCKCNLQEKSCEYKFLLQWPAEMSTFFGKITRVECVLSCQCKCNLQEKSCEFKWEVLLYIMA